MNAGAKVGLGVAGGYVLGRRRKARLAIGLGAYLLGKRMNLSPAQLALSGTQALKGMPEFAELGNSVRGELMTAGRRAAAAAMTQRLESLADTLSERTEALERGGKAAGKTAKGGKKQAHRVIDLTAAESDDSAYPEEPDESGGRSRGRSRTRETARARGRSTRRRRGSADADDEESDAGHQADEAEDYEDDDEPEDVEDEYDDEDEGEEDEYDDEPEDVEDEADEDDELDDEPEDVEDEADEDDVDDEPEDVEDEYDDEDEADEDEPEDVEDEYDDEDEGDEDEDEPDDVEDEYDDEDEGDEDEDETDDRRSPARASGKSRRRQLAQR